MCSARRPTKRNMSEVKIDQRVQEIWSRHEIQGLNPLILNLSLGSWVMCSAHRLTKRNI